MTPRVLALLLAILGLASGCNSNQSQSQAPSPSVSEGTAWWKTEGTAQATAGVGAPLTGAPMAGWTQLPTLNPALASQGQALFKSKGCVSCHSIGKGQVVGPDLLGVTHRAEPDWVARFISDPPAMLESDPRAKELLAKYLVKMPKLPISADELRALQEFFRHNDQAAERGSAPAPSSK